MSTYDAHRNFAASLIAVAPVPAASGTTFSVTAGEGALFPTVPFNVVVWPAGANPTLANAEVLRITSKGTGDNWTATRTQEPQTGSVSRSIAVGDQICAAITAKMITDIETAQAADAAAIAALAPTLTPGGRLTLTTAVAVTTTDVTAAGTLFYTPHVHNQLQLYSGTAWVTFTFPELSIAVPAAASQMYDVFVFDNAGTRTLELLAWTNDTTRATALVKQDGRWCKSGALTRLYVGSFRTTTVVSQTEDSIAKRYVWNYYNRVDRPMRVIDAAVSWAYTTNTLRQANANAANQLDFVLGVQEDVVIANVMANASDTTGGVFIAGIGLDSTTTIAAGETAGMGAFTANSIPMGVTAMYRSYPSVGRHTLVWLEAVVSGTATTWFGTSKYQTGNSSGISGIIKG